MLGATPLFGSRSSGHRIGPGHRVGLHSRWYATDEQADPSFGVTEATRLYTCNSTSRSHRIMDPDKSSFGIEKLSDENFHTWKKRIQFVLSYRELDDYIDDDPPKQGTEDYPALHSAWKKKDKKTQAIIGLHLSDKYLEQVSHAETAKEMWNMICDIFEKHTLLNKLAARRRFYTATMTEGESVLSFSARVRQLAASLKSMGVTVDDKEMAMGFLCGLPETFDSLISALDALIDDNKNFTFQFVVSRCQQEEQRQQQRLEESLIKSETSALVATKHKKARSKCKHCGKQHDSNKCWQKYPHLAPPDRTYHSRAEALITHDMSKPVDDKDDHLLFYPRTVALHASRLAEDYGKVPKGWIIDSGCSAHMTYDRSVFSSYKSTAPKDISLGGGSPVQSVGIGKVPLQVVVNGQAVNCIVTNVQHVPNLRYQLLSVSAIGRLGMSTTFDAKAARIYRKDDNKLVATGTSTGNGLYVLDTATIIPSMDAALYASLELWHQRMAHVNKTGIKYMAEHRVVHGLKFSNTQSEACVGCILGKSHRTPIPKASTSRASQMLELVHSDVLGPIEVPSVGGSRYIISFIDDYSNWITTYTMSRKSECLKYFKKYKTYAERHTSQKMQKLHVHEYHYSDNVSEAIDDLKLKVLRSDNGGEYLSNEMQSFLSEHGIKHELTIAYTPQQNGVAERMNRTLLDLVRSMLHHKSISKRFWAEALATAVYIRNRCTTRALPANMTPHHIWYNEAPNLSHLRVFGSQCWYVVHHKKG